MAAKGWGWRSWRPDLTPVADCRFLSPFARCTEAPGGGGPAPFYLLGVSNRIGPSPSFFIFNDSRQIGHQRTEN